MRSFLGVVSLITVFIAFGLLASGAQERADDETSVLVTPPETDRDRTGINAEANLKSAVQSPNTAGILPPPQKPLREPATRQSNRLARRQPFMRPTEREPADPNVVEPRVVDERPIEESIPMPETSGIAVQPTPRLVTDTDRGARRMYRSSGEVELVMVVKNPADGCLYEIPLCVPACCIGEPTMNEGRGLFGRGVVEYCWECGFTATVKFRHILGDVKVEYDG